MHFKTYCVYDLETTGLDPAKDEAVEIAAMLVKDGSVISSKSWLLRPTVPISDEAARITGITQAMVDDPANGAMYPLDAWEEFLEFAGINFMVPPWPIIGHNIVRFDNLFVERALAKLGFGLDGFEFVDTAAIYKARKLGERPKEGETYTDFARRILDIRALGLGYKLTNVYQELGGSMEGVMAHRAAADVAMTNFIYQKLSKQFTINPDVFFGNPAAAEPIAPGASAGV